MNINANDDYHQFVKGLFKEMPGDHGTLMHAAIGIAGEAGELIDAAKKAWAYGKPLDRDNVIEELGDLVFYAVAMCNVIGVTIDEVVEANVVKLTKRYPNRTYSDEAAIARADKTEESKPEAQQPEAPVAPIKPRIRLIPEGYVSVETAASYLGCSGSFIYTLTASGKLPSERIGKQRRIIPKDGLIAFAKAHGITGRGEL